MGWCVPILDTSRVVHIQQMRTSLFPSVALLSGKMLLTAEGFRGIGESQMSMG